MTENNLEDWSHETKLVINKQGMKSLNIHNKSDFFKDQVKTTTTCTACQSEQIKYNHYK